MIAGARFSAVCDRVDARLRQRQEEATAAFFEACGNGATDAAKRARAASCMVTVARGYMQRLVASGIDGVRRVQATGGQQERSIAEAVGGLEALLPGAGPAYREFVDALGRLGVAVSESVTRSTSREADLCELMIEGSVYCLGGIAFSSDRERNQHAIRQLESFLVGAIPGFGDVQAAKEAIAAITERFGHVSRTAAQFEVELDSLSSACAEWCVTAAMLIDRLDGKTPNRESAILAVSQAFGAVLKSFRDASAGAA
jgi:hypothetical protein